MSANPSSKSVVVPHVDDLLKVLSQGGPYSAEMVLLEGLLDNMKEGVIIAGVQQEGFLLNSAARRMFGRSRVQALPMEKWPEYYGAYHMDGSTLFKAEELPLVRAIRGEGSDNVEMFLRTETIPQGVSILCAARTLKDEKGAIHGGVLFVEDISDLKREKVRTQRLADLVAQTPIGIIETTPDAVITGWNSCAEHIYGYKAQEIVGKHYSLLVPIFKIPVMEKQARQLREGRPVDDHESLRIRKDGRMITTWCAAAPLFDEGRRVRGFVLVTRDITGKTLPPVADQVSEAILLLTPEGRVTGWNTGAERIFGYPVAEAIGLDALALFPESVRESLRGLYAMGRMGQSVYDLDTQGLGKNGRRLYLTLSLTPSKNQEGAVTGLCVVIRDITDLKLAESRIAQWKSVVDSSREGVVWTDLEGRILYFNQVAERLYGYQEREVLGQPFSIFIPEGMPDDFSSILALVRKGQATHFEALRRSKGGNLFYISANLTPMRDAGGQVIGAAAYIRDMTETNQMKEALKRQEALLQQAQKMEVVGRLASGVAHDFNNILAAIRASSLLVGDSPLGEESRQALEELQGSVDRGVELTRLLLQFGGKQPSGAQRLDLNQFLSEEAKILQRLVTKFYPVETRLGEGVPRVEVDPVELRQVVMNLVVNAKDAMSMGGTIRLQTRRWESEGKAPDGSPFPPGPCAWLSVEDKGYGMDPETLKHIFEPFFTTKEEGKGTGLGLAIIYSVVHKYNGRIWVESEPGKGTTFHICFRAAP